MSGFVWYSFGSDVTGKKLAKALNYASGKKSVDFSAHKILLSWGCKPSEKFNPQRLAQLVASRDIRVINPPAAVEANRDKIGFLKEMLSANIPTPGYVASKVGGTEALLKRVKEGIKAGTIMFPLVGHTATHKGDPLFCHTEEDVRMAIQLMLKNTRQEHYFRSFCPGTEYRIHIFRDEALTAQCTGELRLVEGSESSASRGPEAAPPVRYGQLPFTTPSSKSSQSRVRSSASFRPKQV